MSKFNDFLKEQLNDPEVKAEYDALEPEFTIIQAMIDARKASGLTAIPASEPPKAREPVSPSLTSESMKMAVLTPLLRPCSVWLPVWE